MIASGKTSISRIQRASEAHDATAALSRSPDPAGADSQAIDYESMYDLAVDDAYSIFDANDKDHWLYLSYQDATAVKDLGADKEKWKKMTEIYGAVRLQDHLLVLYNLGVPEAAILKKAPFAKGVADRWIGNIRRQQMAKKREHGGGEADGADGGIGDGNKAMPPTPGKDGTTGGNKRRNTGK